MGDHLTRCMQESAMRRCAATPVERETLRGGVLRKGLPVAAVSARLPLREMCARAPRLASRRPLERAHPGN